MSAETATIIAPSKSWEALRKERNDAPAPISRERSAEIRRERAAALAKTLKNDFDVHSILEALDAASTAEVYADAVCHLYMQAIDILLRPWYHEAMHKAGVLNPTWFEKIIESAAMERRGQIRKLVVFDLDGVRYVGFRYAENVFGRSKAAWDCLDPEATMFMYRERIPVAIRAELIVAAMRAIPEGTAGQLAVSAFDADKGLESRQRSYVENTQALEADAARLAKLRAEAEALASPYPDLLDALTMNIEAVNARIIEARKAAFTDTRVGHRSVIITEEQMSDMIPKPVDGKSDFCVEPGIYEFASVNPVGTKLAFRLPTGPDATE